eukprot:30918-Pelagococcus_subviridis.AAC.19
MTIFTRRLSRRERTTNSLKTFSLFFTKIFLFHIFLHTRDRRVVFVIHRDRVFRGVQQEPVQRVHLPLLVEPRLAFALLRLHLRLRERLVHLALREPPLHERRLRLLRRLGRARGLLLRLCLLLRLLLRLLLLRVDDRRDGRVRGDGVAERQVGLVHGRQQIRVEHRLVRPTPRAVRGDEVAVVRVEARADVQRAPDRARVGLAFLFAVDDRSHVGRDRGDVVLVPALGLLLSLRRAFLLPAGIARAAAGFGRGVRRVPPRARVVVLVVRVERAQVAVVRVIVLVAAAALLLRGDDDERAARFSAARSDGGRRDRLPRARRASRRARAGRDARGGESRIG